MRIPIIFMTLAFAACSSTGVVPVGTDTFMIAKKSAQAGFGPPVKTEAAVYEEANAYCESQRLMVETVDKEVRNSTFGRPGSVNLKFRCVDANDASDASASNEQPLEVATDKVRERDSDAVSGNSEADDLYSEILKLDDLRQRGLISDAEFEQEKKELLEKN